MKSLTEKIKRFIMNGREATNMRTRKETPESFVKKLHKKDEFPMDYMILQDAEENLKYFDDEGIKYPEDLTPELYVEIWNRLVDEYELP